MRNFAAEPESSLTTAEPEKHVTSSAAESEPELHLSSLAAEPERGATALPESSGKYTETEWILTGVYTLYILMIIIGNIFIIITMIRKGNLRVKVVHMFIVSLSTADILIGSLVVPSGYFELFYTGNYGFLICKLCHFALQTASCSTIFSLTALTLDRFSRLHFKVFRGRRFVIGMITGVWVAAALYAIRVAVMYGIVWKPVNEGGAAAAAAEGEVMAVPVCTVMPEYHIEYTVFFYLDLVVMFVGPWLIIAICYLIIIRQLTREIAQNEQLTAGIAPTKSNGAANNATANNGNVLMDTSDSKKPAAMVTTTPPLDESDIKVKRRTIRMLILAIIFCFLGLAPNHILKTYLFFTQHYSVFTGTLTKSFMVVGFSNSWIRVILYIVFNEIVHQAFMDILRACGSTIKKRRAVKVEVVPLF